MTKKRAIINLSDKQHEKLEAAAARGGYASVPAYVKIKALEAAEK
jgi:hypothetical protein